MDNYYQQLVDNLETDKVIELMQNLGAEDYEEKENCVIFPTICHNEDATSASKKLYYYKDSHIFYCYTDCLQGMSIFSFLKRYYDTRGIEYDWYNDIVKVVEGCKINNFFNFRSQGYVSQKLKYAAKKAMSNEIFDDKVLAIFEKEYPISWLEDGITEKAMDKFNILYSISREAIIIPHYNVDGELIGIRSRNLNPKTVELVGKYIPISIENKWYSHHLSFNLYGLNQNKENIKQRKIVYLFESEKAVLQLENFNMINCGVAVCGSSFNKYQLQLLLKYCYPSEIIICFDNEEKEGENKYFYKLYNMCKKYNNYCDFSFIYDRKNLTNKKDSPTDNGQEVFEQLIESRVKVK